MDSKLVLSLVAAACTTFSFVPQAIQIIKTKQTKGISLTMYLLFNFGIILWLIYAIWINDLAIILANAITFIFTCTILILKIKNKD